MERVSAAISSDVQVKAGIEAAGHYRRPVGWEISEFNPAHVPVSPSNGAVAQISLASELFS